MRANTVSGLADLVTDLQCRTFLATMTRDCHVWSSSHPNRRNLSLVGHDDLELLQEQETFATSKSAFKLQKLQNLQVSEALMHRTDWKTEKQKTGQHNHGYQRRYKILHFPERKHGT